MEALKINEMAGSHLTYAPKKRFSFSILSDKRPFVSRPFSRRFIPGTRLCYQAGLCGCAFFKTSCYSWPISAIHFADWYTLGVCVGCIWPVVVDSVNQISLLCDHPAGFGYTNKLNHDTYEIHWWMFCNENAGLSNERGIIAHWINVRTDQCVQIRCMLFFCIKKSAASSRGFSLFSNPRVNVDMAYHTLLIVSLNISRTSISNAMVINMLPFVTKALGSRDTKANDAMTMDWKAPKLSYISIMGRHSLRRDACIYWFGDGMLCRWNWLKSN